MCGFVFGQVLVKLFGIVCQFCYGGEVVGVGYDVVIFDNQSYWVIIFGIW